MKYLLVLVILSISILGFSQANVKVQNGDKAIDFAVKTIDGKKVKLSVLNDDNPVVLVILRGWPEYQCPVCSRQVGQFIAEAEKFQALGARVLMIYPGPSDVLQEKAKEFTEDFTFPDNFYFALDPNYSMVNKYGLRWDAPKETAYPSTFVINKKGEIVYSIISSSHRGRPDLEEIFRVLEKL